jgi:hypothetical protein
MTKSRVGTTGDTPRHRDGTHPALGQNSPADGRQAATVVCFRSVCHPMQRGGIISLLRKASLARKDPDMPMLPPVTSNERCREALMRSRVIRWMSQRVSDQRARSACMECHAASCSTVATPGGPAATAAQFVQSASAPSCLEGW